MACRACLPAGFALVLVLLGCTSRGQSSESKAPVDGPVVKVLVAASGATRLLLSRDGRFAVAELGGQWRHEAFPRGDEIPPVLKLIDMTSHQVVATANGWALGAPVGRDEIYLEEHGEEYRYRVRSTARPELAVDLEPPNEALWLVEAGLDVGQEHVAVVLRARVPGSECPHGGFKEWREDLWIAVIHRGTLAIPATRKLENTPYPPSPSLQIHSTRLGGALAGDPTRPQLYLLERPSPPSTAWRVSAYDSSLNLAWQAALDRTSVRPHENARALMTATGDSASLAVAIGDSSYGDISWSSLTFFLVEAEHGAPVKTVPLDLQYPIREIVPALGTPKIGVLHALTYREGLGESVAEFFPGVSVLSGVTGAVEEAFEAEKAMGELFPDAMAMDAFGVVWLAPKYYGWAEVYMGATGLPPAPENDLGVTTREVRGLVTTPVEWHTKKRPRFKELERSLLECREPGPPPSEPPPPLVAKSVRLSPALEKIRSVVEPLYNDRFLADERACQYKDWVKDAADLRAHSEAPPGVDAKQWTFLVGDLERASNEVALHCGEEDLSRAQFHVDLAANTLMSLGVLLEQVGNRRN